MRTLRRARALRALTAALTLLAGTVGVAAPGDGSSVAEPARLPSGSSVSTAIRNPCAGCDGDVDDYRVEVGAGRRLIASLTERGSVPPSLLLEIVDDDGTVVDTDAADRRLRVSHVAAETSSLRVRVRANGDTDPPSGEYTLRVSVSGPTGARVRDALPGPTGEFQFTVPARGGAVVSARASARGPLDLTGVRSPLGTPVPDARTRPLLRGGVLLPLRLPADGPFGDWEITFRPRAWEPDASEPGVSFVATVRGPREPARRGRLAWLEPQIESVTPSAVAAGTVVRLTVANAGDPKPSSPFVVRAGTTILTDVAFDPPGQVRTVRATIPASLPVGTHDVSVETATGQVAALPAGLTRVRAPVAESFLPAAVPAIGGFEVTIRGRDFRPGRMGVRIGGVLAPVIATSTTTTVRFTAPPSSPGETTLGVLDLDTQSASDADTPFLFGAWAEIGAMSPDIVPSLGGSIVSVRGFYFAADDTLEIATATAGTFEAVPSTFVSDSVHEFAAPPRPAGMWGVRIRTASGRISREFPLRTFSWTDATAAWGLAAGAPLDATSSALADFDRDGDSDLVLARDARGAAAATSHTRILRNDGAAGLVDATAAMMPAASASDDWRASRVRFHDVTGDGWPDLVLGSADTDVVPANRSHVRILRNEVKSAEEPDVRVFRDRTADLFPAPARLTALYGSTRRNDTDAWTSHDLWIGDLDSGGDGTPEIVVTTDRTFAAEYVSCTPYCASPYSAGYLYSVYWGGTRVFRWNPNRRAGLGQFERDFHAMPNRMGVTVWIWGAPPGILVPYCPPSSCGGKFTPFTGQRLAAGDVDGDGRTDLVVVSATAPTVSSAEVSALQVFLGRTGSSPGTISGWGGRGTDVTPQLTALGLDLRGDAVAAGWTSPAATPAPIAVGRSSAAAPGTGPGLRLLRYVPGADGAVGTFEDATDALLGPPPPGESWWASALAWEDADGDGRDDLVVLGATAPSGAKSGLRILRATDDGTLRDDVRTLLETAADAGLAGTALSIGDLDGDGGPELVVSRDTIPGAGPATRVLRQER